MYRVEDDFGTTRIAKSKEELPLDEDWCGDAECLET